MIIIPTDYDIRTFGRPPVFPPSPPLDDWAVRKALREAREWVEETVSDGHLGPCIDFENDGCGTLVVEFRTAHDWYSLHATAPSLGEPEGGLICLGGGGFDFSGTLSRETWREILWEIAVYELTQPRDENH